MRFAWVGSLVALVVGVALIAWSVAEGGATLTLVAIVPVISGSSVDFLVGVLLLLVGFVSLPFALAGPWEEEPTPSSPEATRGQAPPERQSGAGGLVLIGPVPILFGTWKGVSRRTRRLLAIGGAVLFTVALVALFLFVR